jgi:hypothetical protein
MSNKGFIYLILTKEAMDSNENVYKIGRTLQKNPYLRLDSYKNGYEIIHITQCIDAILMEKECLEKFKTCYIQRKDYGNEYFEGDRNEMEKMIQTIKTKYNIPLKTESTTPIIQETEKKEVMIIKKKNKSYTCDYCGNNFSKKYNLDIHVKNACKSIFIEKQISDICIYCNIKYSTCGNCKRHMKTCSKNPEMCKTDI